MQQSMRWFGPADPVGLADLRQAGCEGVVTALHHIPNGEAWPIDAILERKAAIEAHGMRWAAVESLPVDERIKTRRPGFEACIA
ncbi:MAG: mannonate dehydratase, partial [Asticcacaulis sp.]|nr:mannonate dehydratase [Asticcacaulis sp.]